MGKDEMNPSEASDKFGKKKPFEWFLEHLQVLEKCIAGEAKVGPKFFKKNSWHTS